MYILILTGVQKGHISGLKNGYNLLKNVHLKLNFQDKVTYIVIASFIFWLFTANVSFFNF